MRIFYFFILHPPPFFSKKHKNIQKGVIARDFWIEAIYPFMSPELRTFIIFK